MSARVSDQERVLRTVSEKAWTNQVVSIARSTGWLIHHSRPAWLRSGKMVTALQGNAGLPDLILLRPPRLVVAELKRQHGGVISPGQNLWLAGFRGVPSVEVFTWRPGDVDAVMQVLAV